MAFVLGGSSKGRKTLEELEKERQARLAREAKEQPVVEEVQPAPKYAGYYPNPTTTPRKPSGFQAYGQGVAQAAMAQPAKEGGRLSRQLDEGLKDVVKHTAKGYEVLAGLAESQKDWDAVSDKESRMPFSSYTNVDKAAFGDYLVEKDIDPNNLDPAIWKDLRVSWLKHRGEKQQAAISSGVNKIEEIFKADPELMEDQTFMEQLFRTVPQVATQALLTVSTGGAVGS